MPEILAHLDDGTTLHFPDGTDPSIVQTAVKNHLGGGGTNQPQPEQTLGQRAVNFIGKMSSQPLDTVTKMLPISPEHQELVKNVVKMGVPFDPDMMDTKLRPVLASVPGGAAAATAAEYMPGGPIAKTAAGLAAGTLGYAATSQAYKRAKNALADTSVGKYFGVDKENTDLTPDLIEGATNELGGRLGGSLLKKLTPEQEELSKLAPTLSQYYQNNTIPKGIEDLLAPSAKATAIKNSGQLADQVMAGKISQVAGRAVPAMDTEALGDTVKGELSKSLQAYKTESNAQASTARLIAGGNQQIIGNQLQDAPEIQAILVHNNVTWDQLQPAGKQDLIDYAAKNGIQPPRGRVISGPIQLSDTLEKANKIIKDNTGLALGVPDEQKPIVNAAFDLVRSTNAKFDPQGNLIKADPVSFSEVWDKKQELDDMAGWNKPNPTKTDTDFRAMTHSINNDVDNSIPKWEKGGQAAYQAWNNAKATVAERNATFFPKDSNVKLGQVINDTTSTLPTMDAVLGDPKKLQKVLNTGAVTFPSGAVASTNARQDMGAYMLKNLWDRAVKVDPSNPSGAMTVDANAIQNAWNDPRIFQQKGMLFNQQTRADLDQFFKNVAATQQKQAGIGAWTKLGLAKGVIALAPALVGGFVHGGEGAATATGLEFGAHYLGKVMTNPRLARAMVAAASGQPLNMSQTVFSRMLMGALQGATVTGVSQDGTKTEGVVDKDGKFTPTDH